MNVGSVAARVGSPGQSVYSGTKAGKSRGMSRPSLSTVPLQQGWTVHNMCPGLEGFSRSLAREVGGRGIRVNVVAPGFIETAMTAELGHPTVEQISQRIPLGEFGHVTDVAEAVTVGSGSPRTRQMLRKRGLDCAAA